MKANPEELKRQLSEFERNLKDKVLADLPAFDGSEIDQLQASILIVYERFNLRPRLAVVSPTASAAMRRELQSSGPARPLDAHESNSPNVTITGPYGVVEVIEDQRCPDGEGYLVSPTTLYRIQMPKAVQA